MKKGCLFLLIAGAVLLTGCVPTDSLHPLITSENAIFEPELLGSWKEVSDTKGSEEVMVISKTATEDPKSYEYTVILGDEKDKGWLGRLDAGLFLDLSPETGLTHQGVHDFPGLILAKDSHQMPGAVRLNDQLLFYMEAVKEESDRADLQEHVRLRVSSVHRFFQVQLNGKRLRLGYLDDERLQKKLGDLKNEYSEIQDQDEGFVLTAPTGILQRLVNELVVDPEVYEWLEFEKVANK